MKLRSMLLLFVLLSAMLVGGFVQAQDMPIDPCFGLAEADCAVINAASANGIGTATSFSVQFDLSFSAANIPDETMPGAVFNASGTVDVVPSANADIPLNIGAAIMAAFGADAASLTEMPVEFRLVDGIAYFTDPSSGAWQGIDVIAAMASPEFQEQLGGLGIDPTAPDMGLGNALGGMTGEMPADFDPNSLMSLVELVKLPGLITYTRSGDTFSFVLDLTAMQALLTPEYEEQLTALTDALSQLDPSAGMLVTLIPTLVQTGTITINQTVNTSLNIVEKIEFVMDLVVDVSAMTGEAGDPINVDLVFNMSLQNLDSAPAPVAPEGATMIDPAAMGAAGQ